MFNFFLLVHTFLYRGDTVKRSNAFLATALFLGGFIPLKGTIPNEKNISYSIYGTISEAKIYIQCNEIKRQILEVYNTLPIYNLRITIWH